MQKILLVLCTTKIVPILLIVLFSKVENAVIPPPWSDPSKNPCATLPGGWQLLYWAPLQKCYKIFQVGHPCPDTMELIPVSNAKVNTLISAECRCPPGTVQSPKTNKCHQLFERGPCEKGEFFSPAITNLSPIKTQTRWGICKEPKICGKGMAFWPKNMKCYKIYARGPCSKGKLFTIADNNIGECKCENYGELGHYYNKMDNTCHEHFTRGSCQGHGELFLPDGKCGCNSSLPQYHIESNQCYELGKTGPCPIGHVFILPDNASEKIQYAACQCKEGYVKWSDGFCYRLYTRGPCNENEFISNSTNCIKNPCSKGRLYFPEEKTCYRIGSQGPCSLNQVVIFDFTTRPSLDGIAYNGLCGCSGVIMNLDQTCTRSNLENSVNTCESIPNMVEINGECYKIYTRGPCGPGQWLEPVKEDLITKAVCRCRPGYIKYENQSDNFRCYAPSVGIARYLNDRNHRSYKFEFPRLINMENQM